MAEHHSKAERQRLKAMLSDAIRALCQNTMRYHIQLSIEALIGVTVDGGEDVVIVSLNELIDKQAADTTFGKEQYHDEAAGDALYTESQADYMEDENGEYFDTEDADQEYADSGELCMPYGTVVKEELMSTIMYGNAEQSHFPSVADSAVTDYETEPYADNPEQYYDVPMNPSNVGLHPGWRPSTARLPATVAGKSQAGGFGVQKQTKPANPGGKKSGRFGGKISADVGGQPRPAAVGKVQSLNGGDAVSQITLYTCGTCGAQMQHHGSFLRHKRSHTSEQTCRCEGCGKLIRRHDNLLMHQRRCQPYLSQFQHGDLGL